MTHSDKAPTAEQLAMASRLASAALQEHETFPETAGGILALVQSAALAAIIETTERAAKLAEASDGYNDVTGTIIARTLRNNDHLKGQAHD